MDNADVAPADIETVDNILKLPMTTKEDFRDEYSTRTFAASMSPRERRQAENRLLHPDDLDVTGTDIYGLSAVTGPGVANECHEAQDGLRTELSGSNLRLHGFDVCVSLSRIDATSILIRQPIDWFYIFVPYRPGR